MADKPLHCDGIRASELIAHLQQIMQTNGLEPDPFVVVQTVGERGYSDVVLVVCDVAEGEVSAVLGVRK